jgi:FemAB-related protein (PEP-CTERM system-associated)
VIRIRPYTEPDAPRWDAYVRSRPESHFGQRLAWKRVIESAYGCGSRYVMAEREDRIVGVLPLFEKRGVLGGRVWFSPPGGLLADDDDAAAALLEDVRPHVAESRLEYLELRDQARAWPGLETVDENCTMVLVLQRDVDAQWDELGTKLRNEVKRGSKSALRVTVGRDDVDDFHRVLSENMRDLGTPILGPGYFRSVLDAFAEEAWMVLLYEDRTPVGAMFLVAHGSTVYDPWASVRRPWRASSANYVLYWEAIRDCVARGFERFDFGRSQRDSGTFAFKKKWSAKPEPLYYQYLLGTAAKAPTVADQKGSFALAVEAWKRLPLPLARALGPVARRRFPEAL